MYLHLGSDTVIKTEDIVSMFDIESTTISKISRNFLKYSEESGIVKNVSEEIPKTFVLCKINGKSVIYITNISTKTLTGRIKKGIVM